MEFSCKSNGNILIVQICGDIDHHFCEKLRTSVDQQIEKNRSKHLLFLLSGVSFMDSSGIGVLIGRYKRIKQLGGRIAVVGAGARIQEIFQLSALQQLFPMFQQEEEAFAYLKGGENI